MLGSGKVRKVVFRVIIFLFVWWVFLLGYPERIFAMESALPKEVVVIRNEKQMLDHMIKGMRKHKSQFAYYYPGIVKDVRRYQNAQPSFGVLMDKLSGRDAYVTGTVSGICVTICGEETRYVLFQMGYLTTRWQERRIDRRVRNIARRIGGGSPARKAQKAHDYLLSHMNYSKHYYSPYHAFFKGEGMCMAYALAYQRLMQELGVPCMYVKGKNHAWNMVKLGRNWYNVDVTWDDGNGGRYRYFLKSDKDFPGHRRPQSKYLSSLNVARHSYPLYQLR